jgi:ketohexokinase
MNRQPHSRILGVGNATVDIVNTVERYPAEDEEVRALSRQVRRGGNATNTLVILSQRGHRCTWAGTLAREPDAQVILSDLERHGVDTTPVHTVEHGKVPTSYIALSRITGSRTIIHHRDLAEYRAEDFARIPLGEYDWVHFEGRNIEAVDIMLKRAGGTPGLRRSLEVEKPREGIERLFPLADLLLFSRVYARSHGFSGATTFLESVRPQAPQALLVCAWGEQGAYALAPGGSVIHVAAAPPARVVDTLGAGDALNAGIIDGLLRGEDLEQALTFAVRLAGKKCGQPGLEGLD